MTKHKIYTFYAELKDYEPKIWRRFEINGEKTIAELVYTSLIMFEMQASHQFTLIQFTRDAFLESLRRHFAEDYIKNMLEKEPDLGKDTHYEFSFGDVFLNENERLVEPDTVRLQSVVSEKGMKFLLNYDYGDNWEVSLKVENIIKEDISLSLLPRVIEGDGYGIIEDIGGVDGLMHLAEILKKGKGKDYDDFTNGLDSTTLALESFDKKDMNFRLKKLIRMYRDSYEYGQEPTEVSLKLLLRDYLNKGNQGY